MMRSYVEENARATTPVTYFMQAPKSPDRSMDDEPSTSLGNSSRETADEGVWPDHVYDEMEEEMQRNRRHAARRKRVREDAPWRPEESVHSDEDGDDSGIDGVGVVAGGGLAGRSATRGKAKEKGEGYLGQGLGIRRRPAGKSRGPEGTELEGINETELEVDEHMVNDYRPSPRPQQHYLIRDSSVLPTTQPHRDSSFWYELTHALARGRNKLSPYMAKLFKAGVTFVLGVVLLLTLLSVLSWIARAVMSTTPSKSSTPTFSAPAELPENFDEFTQRFHAFEKGLGDVSQKYKQVDKVSRAATALSERIASLEEKIASLESVTNAHHSDMAKYGRVVDDVRSELADITQRVGGHDRAVGKLEHNVEALNTRISSVELAVSDGRLRSALERILPDMLPVRDNGKDGLVITPAFWLALKEVLVGKTELASEVRRIINDGVPVASSEKVPTELSKKLEAMVHDLVTKQSTHLVDKASFLTLLESELEGMRRELRGLREDWRQATPSVAIKDRKGRDLTSEVQHLIDAALLRYSKDTIAKADYALFSSGASVIPSHTTDTLVVSRVGKFFHLFTGQQDVLGNPPATALTPDNTVGNCWAFKGSNGSLGIQLSRKIVVTHITVEHLAKELALDTSSAPRDIEVWAGLEDTDPSVDLVDRYLQDYPHEYVRARPTLTRSDTLRAQSPTLFLLAKFAYDVTSESPIQTFPVRDALVAQEIPVRFVVVQVDSNSGADYTCLYRVGVWVGAKLTQGSSPWRAGERPRHLRGVGGFGEEQVVAIVWHWYSSICERCISARKICGGELGTRDCR